MGTSLNLSCMFCFKQVILYSQNYLYIYLWLYNVILPTFFWRLSQVVLILQNLWHICEFIFHACRSKNNITLHSGKYFKAILLHKKYFSV